MRLVKFTYTDKRVNRQRTRLFTSKAAAVSHRAALCRDAIVSRGSGTIEEVEVESGKSNLVNFINLTLAESEGLS